MPGLVTSGPALDPAPALTPSPGRKRTVVVPLILVLLLDLTGWHVYRQQTEQSNPDSLLSYILDGPRGPACLTLVIGMDVSGSMADFAEARDSALRQLQEWARAPRTLRPNDQIAIVDFAFEAATRFPPTPLAQSPTAAAGAVDDGTETLLGPMLEQTKQFPASDCDSVVLLLSDAQISDLPVNPDEGDRLLREYGVHDIRFLVPGNTIVVPEEWSRAFPSAPPIRFDGLDAKETALTIGRTVGELTRQRFVPTSAPATR